ncbi:hypothetical protein D3C86_1650710 [compost metagenome]
MPNSRNCASMARACSTLAGLAKNSRSACLPFSLRPFITLSSSQSWLSSITRARLPALSAKFFAPVTAMPAIFSLSSRPARVAQPANSGCTSPSSCSSIPRSSNSAITLRLCASRKKL